MLPATPSPHTLLIVDDEENIRSALSTFLARLGYRVLSASTGSEALAIVERQEPDLVLLDVILDESNPAQMSGLEVCQRLRSRSRFIPIIMLTSYPEWQVESLGQGAIAFITKPWDNNALANQIRATLGAIPDLHIDTEHLRVTRDGRQIDLTPIEFALLAFLARHPNRQWAREDLLTHVWGTTWAGFERTVDRHVAALRRKLGLQRDELIETIHGIGYRLVTG
ncbi:MAG: response regulator transcription factor [Anaerolineae bacterium]|nr:response regulator transcription factor [Anaerolineae bacterium]